jgi:hypothetical protein
MMDSKKAHKQLYRKIPDFKCVQGCNSCCGTVPLSDWEADRLGQPSGVTPTDSSGSCEFLSVDGCTVYDKRPLMCRLFGSAEHKQLTCPQGMAPKKPLTAKQANGIRETYLTVVSHDQFKATIGKASPKPNALTIKAP